MKLSRRESIMAMVTAAVVLVGGSIWLGDPWFRAWRSGAEEERRMEDRLKIADRLIAQEDAVKVRFEALRQGLQTFPAGEDVTAQLLRKLQGTAAQHQLVLLSQTPDEEKRVGRLYELSITCSWEGSLDSMVRFLYALQEQGAIVDVQQLSITPVRGESSALRGMIKVDYAYSRSEGSATASNQPRNP